MATNQSGSVVPVLPTIVVVIPFPARVVGRRITPALLVAAHGLAFREQARQLVIAQPIAVAPHDAGLIHAADDCQALQIAFVEAWRAAGDMMLDRRLGGRVDDDVRLVDDPDIVRNAVRRLDGIEQRAAGTCREPSVYRHNPPVIPIAP